MKDLDRLQNYLLRMNCRFTHDRHPLTYRARETAAAEHLPTRCFAKTLVLHGETGYLMCVLPSDRSLDIERIREAMGWSRLRLATESELAELYPDSELGAMPPFGNHTLFAQPVVVDARLLAEGEIAFNAGTHHDVLRMSAADWRSLVKPAVLELGRTEALTL